MPTNDFSDEIVIRFALTKGDGDFPSEENLTDNEIAYPQSICNFHLDLDYGKFDIEPPPLPLKEVTILYDGIEDYSDTDHQGKLEANGLYWSDAQNQLVGYPAPIIKFKFSQLVHKESFLYLVCSSSVNICSKLQKENDSYGYYYEDYAGWASVLEGSNLKKWIKFLKDNGIFSGRKFNYIPDEDIFPLTRE
jgi:hypothetical protein